MAEKGGDAVALQELSHGHPRRWRHKTLMLTVLT